ncbi:MAG TPA: hypothetical protein VKB63_15135 [Gemmatimonadales bacterium]|nr:hypothetical protein [Gemmatimonadales bacterium]
MPVRAGAMLLVTLLLGVPGTVSAQCSDGSAPPCARHDAPQPRSVAVLYFENLSHDTTDAMLAEGFSEELMVELGKVEPLRVATRGQVLRLRGRTPDPVIVGRALSVAYIVSGTIRRSGQRLVVTAELASTNGTGQRVWGEVFDRSSGDLLDVQSSVARAAATAIAGRLGPADRAILARRSTSNAVAWEHYLRGTALLARRTIDDNLAHAVYELDGAVQLDPTFASAWARLAEALLLVPSYPRDNAQLNPDSLLAQGARAADRALALDSASGAAWMAHGIALDLRDRQWWDALRAYRRAVTLDSTDAETQYHYGTALRHRTTNQVEAERHLRLAHTLDPTLLNAVEWLARLMRDQGRVFEAGALLDSIAADSQAAGWGGAWQHHLGADIDLRRGDTAAARRTTARIVSEVAGRDSLRTLAYAAELTARLGDVTGARALLARATTADGNLDRRVAVASAEVALGDYDRAIGDLEAVASEGSDLWDNMRQATFDPLRGNPRFARLLEKVWPRVSL